jgi:hypothetical protein
MPDKRWKRAERTIAKKVGGTRTPLSGPASGHTSADVIHPWLYVEVKYRKRFAVLSLMAEVAEKAKKELKVPVLALQQKGKKTRYYLVNEQTFLMLLQAYEHQQALEGEDDPTTN